MDQITINQHVKYSRVIQGFFRAHQWQKSTQAMNRFIHELVERGVTTMDHADIYGHYTVEKCLEMHWLCHLNCAIKFKS